MSYHAAMPTSLPSTQRPNILLITSDQQHWDTLGVTNPKVKTPHLDRLCREGTRFTRAYCPNPTCTPTRASIITGMYPSLHGAWTLGTMLPHDVVTVGDHLRHAGYDASLIGKAHFQPLDSGPPMTPLSPATESLERQPTLRDLEFWRRFNDTHTPWYGFNHCELARNHADESHVGQHYALWMEENGLSNWREYFQPWPEGSEPLKHTPRKGDPSWYGTRAYEAWDLPVEHHYSTWTAERTIARLDHANETGQPFFLWSSFHDPHPPYVVPEPYFSMYDPADMEPGTLVEGEMEAMPPWYREAVKARGEADFGPWRGEGVVHGFHGHRQPREQMQRDMAVYFGMISLMDACIGRVLDRLDELGMAENTIVVFTTDHGHFLGHHGLIAKGPYHYEDVLRVPFVVRWPGGGVKAGVESEAIQSLVDLAPTFLSAAGLAEGGGGGGCRGRCRAWTRRRRGGAGSRPATWLSLSSATRGRRSTSRRTSRSGTSSRSTGGRATASCSTWRRTPASGTTGGMMRGTRT